MTEASKARKRKPMLVITMRSWQLTEEQRKTMLDLIKLTPPMVLPAEARMTILQPKWPRPVAVLTTGVSTRAGVGGRRGERRRRARERRMVVKDTTLGAPRWLRANPDPMSAEEQTRLEAALRGLRGRWKKRQAAQD